MRKHHHRTQPRQAASARSLDRWQASLRRIFRAMEARGLINEPWMPALKRLLHSMERAERR